MNAGGEVEADVSEGVLDSSERLVVGKIDEFVRQAFDDTVSLALESLEELLTPLFTFASRSERVVPVESTTARSTTFSSSRTLPGQW